MNPGALPLTPAGPTALPPFSEEMGFEWLLGLTGDRSEGILGGGAARVKVWRLEQAKARGRKWVKIADSMNQGFPPARGCAKCLAETIIFLL